MKKSNKWDLEMGKHIPGDPVLIETEVDVELDQLVVVVKGLGAIIRLEVRLVKWLPLVHDILLGKIPLVIHDEIARVVVRPRQRAVVGPVTVDVERDQEREIPIVPVDGRDQHVVPLGRRKTELVGLLLLDVIRVVGNHLHGVRVKVDHGRSEGGKVDDADAGGLALLERDERSLALVDKDIVGQGRREVHIGCGEHVLHRDDAAVAVPGKSVSVWLCSDMGSRGFLPIRDSQDVLVIIVLLVGVIQVVDNEGATQTVRVLAHVMRVVCHGLASLLPSCLIVVGHQYDLHQKVPGPSTVKRYVSDEPGGIGHCVEPVEPSMSGVQTWLMPWKCMPVVWLPSWLWRVTTTVSPTLASMVGQGHSPLMPIMERPKSPWLAHTQVTFQL